MPIFRLGLVLVLLLVGVLFPIGGTLWLAIIIAAFLASVTPRPSGLLLLVTGALVLSSWMYAHGPRGALADIPVDMPFSEVGHFRTPEFSLNRSYEVGIFFDRAIAPDEFMCLAELRTQTGYDDRCAGRSPGLAATWTLLDSGRIVDMGSSEFVHSGTLGSRNLGGIAGELGHTYVLEIDVTKLDPQLAALRPRLFVQVPPLDSVGDSWAFTGILLLSAMLMVWGLVLVLRHGIERLKLSMRPVS